MAATIRSKQIPLGTSISLWLFARRLTPAERDELAGYLAYLAFLYRRRRRHRARKAA